MQITEFLKGLVQEPGLSPENYYENIARELFFISLFTGPRASELDELMIVPAERRAPWTDEVGIGKSKICPLTGPLYGSEDA